MQKYGQPRIRGDKLGLVCSDIKLKFKDFYCTLGWGGRGGGGVVIIKITSQAQQSTKDQLRGSNNVNKENAFKVIYMDAVSNSIP